MERTKHPGIYKRGSRYVVAYRANGRQKRETVATLRDALRIKRAREADRDRGEYQEHSRRRLRDYAEEWVETYQGRGRAGFREGTRDEYRRDLARYAYPFFDERLGRTVSGVTPRDVAAWIAWLCDEEEQGRRLADATVRRIVAPARACFASARREGLIRHNPADGATLPHREWITDDEEERARVFTREQLDALLRVVHPRHRPMFRLLAATGLRWSELVALRRRDLALDGSAPRVTVRRALVRGRYGPPKSRHGRRDVPLAAGLVSELRAHLARLGPGKPDDLAFPNTRGGPLDYSDARRRLLRPAAEEAGAPWAAFHTFRHTFASLHVARGTTLVQLSRLLGHHSPEFTLRVYAHLIPGDEPAPLDLVDELSAAEPDATGAGGSPSRVPTVAR